MSYQWGIWQHELYQQIHSSNVSRPSHLCICQYIQHPLPLLVECSIPSSRCGHVWMSSFQYSSHRVLGSLLIISLVCSLCWYSFLILQISLEHPPHTLQMLLPQVQPFPHSVNPSKSSYSSFSFVLVAIDSQSKMTIHNIISNENMKFKQPKRSIFLNIYPLDSLTFIRLVYLWVISNSMSYKAFKNSLIIHEQITQS